MFLPGLLHCCANTIFVLFLRDSLCLMHLLTSFASVAWTLVFTIMLKHHEHIGNSFSCRHSCEHLQTNTLSKILMVIYTKVLFFKIFHAYWHIFMPLLLSIHVNAICTTVPLFLENAIVSKILLNAYVLWFNKISWMYTEETVLGWFLTKLVKVYECVNSFLKYGLPLLGFESLYFIWYRLFHIWMIFLIPFWERCLILLMR